MWLPRVVSFELKRWRIELLAREREREDVKSFESKMFFGDLEHPGMMMNGYKYLFSGFLIHFSWLRF